MDGQATYGIRTLRWLWHVRTVEIVGMADASAPSDPEPDLSQWRPLPEVETRSEILEAAADFILRLRVGRGTDDTTAYRALMSLAPEFL
jgi:hypothetical protein